jgi:hypothetical protein
MKKLLGTLALAFVLTSAAQAGPTEANTCAEALSKPGKLMFKTVAPHVKPDSTIELLMRTHLRDLVITGKLDMADAQANGMAVGQCLALLRR